MGKKYESEDFTYLLNELNGNAAKQLSVTKETESGLLIYESEPIPENADVQYEKSLNILNSMLIGGFDEDIDYGKHIEVVEDIFKTIMVKDAVYWRTLETKLGCFDAKDKNRIINYLYELANAWDSQDEDDFNFYADRLAQMSGFCKYVANYNHGDTFSVAEKRKESEKLHRILSNEKIKYVCSEKTKTIHDKSCMHVKEMDDFEVAGLETYVGLYTQCPECAKKAYIRMGAKDIKEYEKYEKLFELMDVDLEAIKEMYLHYGFKTKLSSMRTEGYKYSNMPNNAITVWFRDDTWRIGVTNIGMVRLEHNNYKKKENGEREFTQGFHIQNDMTYSTKIKNVIDYIIDYRYEDHFKVKAQKATKAIKSIEIKDVIIRKLTFKEKVIDFFVNLFIKDRIRNCNLNTVVPDMNQICLYMYKDDNNKKHWMCGRYLAKRKEFSMFCQDCNINTPLQNVIKWIPVDQINAE